jgi:hypothetical protein
VGRPSKLHADEATLSQLRSLGMIHCTLREAAAFLQVAPSTFYKFLLEPGVREAFEEGQAAFRVSLRRNQARLSEKNAAMAIFLGKNYLGQKDTLTHSYDNMDPEERRRRILELSEELGFK